METRRRHTVLSLRVHAIRGEVVRPQAAQAPREAGSGALTSREGVQMAISSLLEQTKTQININYRDTQT